MLPRDNQGVRLSVDVTLQKDHLYLAVSALLYLSATGIIRNLQ